MSVVYDTGVLLAAERGDHRAWLLHKRALMRKWIPAVPAPVLAQAWRGGPQPQLSRLLGACTIVPLGETYARETGRVCAVASVRDVVDAFVVVLALDGGHSVATSDPDDILRIAAALRIRLDVIAV